MIINWVIKLEILKLIYLVFNKKIIKKFNIYKSFKKFEHD